MRKTGIVFTNAVMGPEGEAAVVSFNDSVDNLENFTIDHDRIQNTINNLKAGSDGSRLFDAMTMALEILCRLRPRPTSDSRERQRVMLIMSEGIDAGSEMRLGAVCGKHSVPTYRLFRWISTALAAWKAPPGKKLDLTTRREVSSTAWNARNRANSRKRKRHATDTATC